MKRYALVFGKYLAAFIALMALFCAAMYLACSFDSQYLKEQVQASTAILAEQGRNPVVFTPLDVQNDSNTDALMINEMYSVDSREPFVSSQRIRRNYSRALSTTHLRDTEGAPVSAIYDPTTGQELFGGRHFEPIKELQQFLAGQLHTTFNYGRYWHGYFVVYRPLLVFFNITQIRNLLLATYGVLLAGFLYLLYRRFGRDITFIFAASLIGGGYFTASFSLQASCMFLALMISAIVLVKRLDKIRDFNLYLFAVACITNFVDYLTVPMMTLGVLEAIHLLHLRQEGYSWQYCLRQLVVNSAVWLLGYASTWYGKWQIYDLFLTDGQSMVVIGLHQVMFRMSRDSSQSPWYHGKYIFLTIMMIGKASLVAVLSLVVLLYLHKFNLVVTEFNHRTLPYLLLSLIPVVWYLATANHTEIHFYFTFRLTAVFTLGLLLAIQELFWGIPEKAKDPITEKSQC